MYSAETIAQVTGAPIGNVAVQWPLVVSALKWAGIDSHNVRVAAVGTIAREAGSFWPIEEIGDETYFRNELGDQWYYHGRGLVMITWLSNYQHFGAELGVDLVNHPELAMRNDISAKVLALFFKERGTAAAANAGNWGGVQTTVNGGWINWDVCKRVIDALLAIPEPPDVPPVTKVAVAGPLLQHPDPKSPEAIGPTGYPVSNVPVGTIVAFVADPHDAQHRIVAGDLAHVQLHNSVVHGWFARLHLQTTGG